MTPTDAVTTLPSADLTGVVLGTIGTLSGILSTVVVILRTRGDRAPAPQTPHAAPVWQAIDELREQIRVAEKEAAREYARREDLDEMKAVLQDVDRRSQRTQTILETVFRERLRREGIEGG